MIQLEWTDSLFVWAITVVSVVALGLILAGIRKWPKIAWWKQVLLILGGYVCVFHLGVLLISPTGPGSERIVFILLLVYSFVLAILGSRIVRVIGLLLALVFIIMVILSTKERWDFEGRMKEKAQQQSLEIGK
jgi:disulfide bond formation protein DsbB